MSTARLKSYSVNHPRIQTFNKVKEGGKKFLGGLFSKLAGASGGSRKREFEEAYSHMLQREMGDYEQEAIARDLQSVSETFQNT